MSPPPNPQHAPEATQWRSAFSIALIYAVIGVLWIVLSDLTLLKLVKSPDQVNLLQTYKGWFFIAVTAAILFFMVRWNNIRLMRASRQLQAHNEQLHMVNAAVDAADASIIVTDAEGIILFVNSGFERLTGYRREEAVGLRPDDVVRSHKHPQEFHDRLWQTISSGESWKGRICNRCKDGSLVEVDSTISPIFNAGRRIVGFVGVNRDITLQRALEEQLRHSQKMEAVGQLAGGVAHDFNNLLQVILGQSELLLCKDFEGRDTRNGLEQVVEAAERATTLVRQLLTFSRNTPAEMKLLDLNRVIGDLARMLRRVIGANIHLEIENGGGEGFVKADAGQIEQILMNLCVNARDAIGGAQGNGNIRIATEHASLDAAFCEAHPWGQPGEFVRLSVRDTGCGIPEHLLERIFDPFFTTKEVGKGTGLGLATVYGIVRQHEALISVESIIGEGTVFEIYWPVAHGELENLAGEARKGLAAGQGERILLAEDNELVRGLTVRILASSGYEVVAANDGLEALEIFGRNPGQFDLAVLDIMMPNMGGHELCRRLRGLRPDLPIVFCSGFTPEEKSSFAQENPPFPLLQKPFRPQELLTLVRRQLRGEAEGEEFPANDEAESSEI